MKSIVEKCVEWNAARYEQEYNYELAVELLLEEIEELHSAASVIDMLDAIGDITFVAIGVMWKLGIPTSVIEQMFYNAPMTKLNPHESYNWCCQIHSDFVTNMPDKENDVQGLLLATYSTFITALGTLRGLGMQNSFYDIVHAICDSNNTKEVKGKTAASIKANIVKGKEYIPPTKRLMEIEALYTSKMNIQ